MQRTTGGTRPKKGIGRPRAYRKTQAPLKQTSDDSRNTDAILDMIDQRISGLLVRSGEIESKIEGMEVSSERPVLDFSKPETMKLRHVPPMPPRSSNQVLLASTSPRKESTLGSGEIGDIIASIRDMTAELKDMKEEQRRMSTKINEIHTLLFESQEDEDA